MRALLATILLLLATTPAEAKPVSFKDGYGVMSSYTPDRFDTELNYSFSNRQAVGLSTIQLLDESHDTPRFYFAQLNFLVKRWNELESQANLYLSLGAGGLSLDETTELAGMAAVEADYETRRVYTSIIAENLQAEGAYDSTRLRYRAGIAPYLAPFESLQTWIIGQVEFNPDLEEELTVTPLLRFFYNNLALELGSSVKGEVFIGTMIHY